VCVDGHETKHNLKLALGYLLKKTAEVQQGTFLVEEKGVSIMEKGLHNGLATVSHYGDHCTPPTACE